MRVLLLLTSLLVVCCEDVEIQKGVEISDDRPDLEYSQLRVNPTQLSDDAPSNPVALEDLRGEYALVLNLGFDGEEISHKLYKRKEYLDSISPTKVGSKHAFVHDLVDSKGNLEKVLIVNLVVDKSKYYRQDFPVSDRIYHEIEKGDWTSEEADFFVNWYREEATDEIRVKLAWLYGYLTEKKSPNSTISEAVKGGKSRLVVGIFCAKAEVSGEAAFFEFLRVHTKNPEKFTLYHLNEIISHLPPDADFSSISSKVPSGGQAAASVLAHLVKHWSSSDPNDAFKALSQRPPEFRKSCVDILVDDLFDAKNLEPLLAEMKTGTMGDLVCWVGARCFIEDDEERAWQLVRQIEDGELKLAVSREIFEVQQTWNRNKALEEWERTFPAE